MRELNAFEKKIAKKIANSSKIRIEGLFTPSLLDKFSLKIDSESNDVKLYFNREKNYEEDKDTIKKQFFMELISITSLIQLFEKEGYLISFCLDFAIESSIYIGLKKIRNVM